MSKPLLSIALAVLVLLLSALSIRAQEITSVDAQGTCRDFTITVSTANLSGCWDLKIDAPCEIQDSNMNWQSCFFYLNNNLCSPESLASAKIILDSSQPEVQATAKIRQNNTVIEKPFTISQDCPQDLSGIWTILVAVIIILVFGFGIAWWWKGK